MFCAPIVKLKSDKIPLKRLSACVNPATKLKQTILYKKILKMAIKAFRVPVSTTTGTYIIDRTQEIERIAVLRRRLSVLRRTTCPMRMTGAWADGNGSMGPALAVRDFDNRTRTRDSIVQLYLPSYHPLSRNEER